MKRVQCLNGHYYDGDVYSYCPHCGTGDTNTGNEKKTRNNNTRSRGTFLGKQQQVVCDDLDKTFVPDTESQTFLQTDPTVMMEHTLGYLDDKEDTEFEDEDNQDQQIKDNQKKDDSNEKQSNVINSSTNTYLSGQSTSIPETELSGKTFGYFHVGVQSKDAFEEDAEPIVGWLVCVQGAHLFESFSLYAEKNTIGRDFGNMIVIEKDQNISRNKHAVITYEPKKRQFFISSGDGNGLTYINNKMVSGLHKMKQFDIIEMGRSRFIFIPLCGKHFSWEDYLRS